MSRFFRWSSWLAVLLFAAGCAHFSHPKSKKKATRAEEVVHRIVGAIAMVDSVHQFVLVNVGTVTQAPPEGTSLDCFRNGSQVGSIVVTRDQNPPFLVANIHSGSLQQGDLVQTGNDLEPSIGKVAQISKFKDEKKIEHIGAVLELDSNAPAPKAGTPLACFRDGVKVATVVVSAANPNPPFIDASVTQGEPKRGDTLQSVSAADSR